MYALVSTGWRTSRKKLNPASFTRRSESPGVQQPRSLGTHEIALLDIIHAQSFLRGKKLETRVGIVGERGEKKKRKKN